MNYNFMAVVVSLAIALSIYALIRSLFKEKKDND